MKQFCYLQLQLLMACSLLVKAISTLCSKAQRQGATILLLGASLQLACAAQPKGAAEPKSTLDSKPPHAIPQDTAHLGNGDKASDPPPKVELLYPRLPHVWLGVELKARDPLQAGVLVQRVLPGSPAEKARLSAGDIIISLGDRALNSPSEVSEAVRGQGTSSTKALLIERVGQRHLVRIQFEGMPEFEDRLRLAFVGRKAPEISGMVAFQGEVSSLDELRGQVVVLEFWASFCQVCRMMGPTLDAWHKSYVARGAQVVGITVDLPQVGLEVARRAQMEYPLGSDPDAEITRSYMASQIPTLFIIDARGIIRDAIVGYSPERLSAAQTLIERLLVDKT